MSTEKDENKALQDDEKFINELYAELENELSSAASEQPSKSFDESILAAAHNAVAIGSNATKSTVEKLPEVDKSRPWYVPISLAASTLLVVSLVVNQGGDIFPNDTIQPESIAVQADVEPEHVVATEKQRMSKRSFMAERKELIKGKARQADKMARMPSLMTKQESDIAESGLAAMTNDSLQGSLQASLQDSLDRKEAQIPRLSNQQYLHFKKQSFLWSLHKELNDDYLINVFSDKNIVVQYKLSKEEFLISDMLDGESHKLSFEQITPLNKK